MQTLVFRLEAVTARLEAVAGAGGVATPALAQTAVASSSGALASFDAVLSAQLTALTSASSALGGPVQAATAALQKALEAQRSIVAAVAACKQPTPAELQKLLGPLGAALNDSALLYSPLLAFLAHDKRLLVPLQSAPRQTAVEPTSLTTSKRWQRPRMLCYGWRTRPGAAHPHRAKPRTRPGRAPSSGRTRC